MWELFKPRAKFRMVLEKDKVVLTLPMPPENPYAQASVEPPNLLVFRFVETRSLSYTREGSKVSIHAPKLIEWIRQRTGIMEFAPMVDVIGTTRCTRVRFVTEKPIEYSEIYRTRRVPYDVRLSRHSLCLSKDFVGSASYVELLAEPRNKKLAFRLLENPTPNAIRLVEGNSVKSADTRGFFGKFRSLAPSTPETFRRSQLRFDSIINAWVISRP